MVPSLPNWDDWISWPHSTWEIPSTRHGTWRDPSQVTLDAWPCCKHLASETHAWRGSFHPRLWICGISPNYTSPGTNYWEIFHHCHEISPNANLVGTTQFLETLSFSLNMYTRTRTRTHSSLFLSFFLLSCCCCCCCWCWCCSWTYVRWWLSRRKLFPKSWWYTMYLLGSKLRRKLLAAAVVVWMGLPDSCSHSTRAYFFGMIDGGWYLIIKLASNSFFYS